MRRNTPIAAVAIALTALLSSCSADGAAPAAATAERSPVAVSVLDVRTPQEFAEGHLDGAQLMSVEAADFDERIASLPKDASYLIYCRSGNRANAAIARMRAAGFTDLTNLGSVDAAASVTGRPVVR